MIPIHIRKTTRWVHEDTTNSTINTNTENKDNITIDNQLEDILNNLEGLDSEEQPNEYELIIFP